jgi:hypothetical protein
MPALPLTRWINPWKYRREQAAATIGALRARDGEECARCRRPMLFDATPGHDRGAAIETVAVNGGAGLDNLRLCHPRCHAPGIDHSDEVAARMRAKNETELFARARKRRRKAA